jgi:hypothetical protein
MRPISRIALVALIITALAGCDWFKTSPPDVKFAPDNADFRQKMDLAEVEYKYPLLPADLSKLTPANLATLSQEQIDQIYARLSAGPIPDGPFDGAILFPRGSSGKFRAAEIMGGLTGTALQLKGIALDEVGRVALARQGVLSRRARAPQPDRRPERAQEGRPRRRRSEEDIGRRQGRLAPVPRQALLRPEPVRFAARVDHHRLLLHRGNCPGIRKSPISWRAGAACACATRSGWCGPASISGRAYLDRVFGLNFTLYNKAIADKDGPAFVQTGQVKEDCWVGTQPRAYASGERLRGAFG